jgi:hypothetical protein
MPTNPLEIGFSKFCRRCKLSKLLTDFGVWSESDDGRQSYCLECSPKRQEIERQRIKDLQHQIDELKIGHPCTDCKNDFIPRVMDFDHKFGSKLENISFMVRKYSIENILLEISKCELVCKNCHRKRTRARATRKPVGTLSPSRRLQIRKTIMIDELKSAPCSDCHIGFPPECMDFDHINNDKIIDISGAIRSKGYRFILEELKKTELVCAVCHQLRTINRVVTTQEEAA